MNQDLEVQIQNYLKEITQKIPKDYPDKQKILHMIEHNLHAYIEEHPSAAFEDVTEEFGTSAEVIDSLIKDLSGTDIHRTLTKKRRKKNLLLLLCMLLFIILIFTIRHFYLLWDSSVIIFEETLIVYDTELEIE